MIKIYNAGDMGKTYSVLTIQKSPTSASINKGSLTVVYSDSGRTLIMNPEQVLKLYEVLGEFIKKEGIIREAGLFVGDSL